MRKLLQNSLFAALAAWAVYGMQAHHGQQAASTETSVSPFSGGRTSSGGPDRL